MANFDNPNSFDANSGAGSNIGDYIAGGTFARGDLLALNVSGRAVLYDIAAHNEALGLAATAGVSGAACQVYDDPDLEFVGQCSGTLSATMIGDRVDIEGTSGIQEIDENASVVGVVKIVRHYSTLGSTAVGLNSRVVCKIVKHAMASGPDSAEGTQTFETATATVALVSDTINERTAAAGVVVDGVKLKDFEIIIGAAAINADTVKARVGIATGLPANGAGYGSGSLFIAIAGGAVKLHVNTGTDAAMTWTVVGTQA